MALQEVGGQVPFVSAKNLLPGQVAIAGWFIGEFTGKYGQAFKFLKKDGTQIAIRDYAIIRRKLEEIAHMENPYCEIVYDGKYIIKTGSFAGREGQNFRLLVDPDMEGPSGVVAMGGASKDEGEDDLGDQEDEFDMDLGDDDIPF